MKNRFLALGARLAALPILLLPSATYAQLNKASDNLQQAQPAGAQTDLPTLIGNLINAILGVVGILFVAYTVYAGYLYMTAQGDDEKTGKAKTMLGQAVIGIVIIAAAYAISNFVIEQLITGVQN